MPLALLAASRLLAIQSQGVAGEGVTVAIKEDVKGARRFPLQLASGSH